MKYSDTALIIIDMQNDFLRTDSPLFVPDGPERIPLIAEALESCRKASIPVFHIVREYREDGSDVEVTRLRSFLDGQIFLIAGTEGCEIVEPLRPLEGEYRIVKNRFSAFMNTELDFMLRRLRVQSVVICGLLLQNCIRATIFDAISLGYEVTLLTDASAAKCKEIADYNICDIKGIGVECIDTQSFISHL